MSHAMDNQRCALQAACGMSCMRRGAFEAAWTISDAVLHVLAGVPCWHWPRHLQYIWDGYHYPDKRVKVGEEKL
jgi:hypothetical protein